MVMELVNNILAQLLGSSFTRESLISTAEGLSFLHTIKKAVEDELRGLHETFKSQIGQPRWPTHSFGVRHLLSNFDLFTVQFKSIH